MKIPIEVSARHVHLSEKDFEALFGKNKKINPIKKLSQNEDFAAKETLTIINSDSGEKIKDVRVLGPFRDNSQAEISLTDAHTLKFKILPEIKVSGDLGNVKITVENNSNSIKIPCIIAQRHLHCSPNKAKILNLKNNQEVSIKISGKRGITFHNIIVRINRNFRLALHLDTDEGNSAGIQGKTFGEIVKN